MLPKVVFPFNILPLWIYFILESQFLFQFQNRLKVALRATILPVFIFRIIEGLIIYCRFIAFRGCFVGRLFIEETHRCVWSGLYSHRIVDVEWLRFIFVTGMRMMGFCFCKIIKIADICCTDWKFYRDIILVRMSRASISNNFVDIVLFSRIFSSFQFAPILWNQTSRPCLLIPISIVI